MDPDARSVTAETDQEDCARLSRRYDLHALPVVDGNSRLLGVIPSGDLVDVTGDEAAEETNRTADVSYEKLYGPLSDSIRRRLPWLMLNLGTLFVASMMIGLFDSIVAKAVVLAVLLPIVPGQGALGGIQTLTVIVRAIALKQAPQRFAPRLLRRELSLGILNGIALGTVVGVGVYLWKGNHVLGLILAVAMFGNMIVGALAGVGVPLLFRKFGVDPAVSSAVVVTTVTDVMGYLAFLGLASMVITLL
jgi:magnesium transporter